MNKIINGVATEYEIPEQRYLKCETLTGEWWYKDMKTGKDLPLFTTPIPEREETKITYETGNIKELERITIDLLQELDKYKNIIDELEKRLNELIKEYEDYYKTSPVDWEKRKGVSNTWLNSRDCYWSILNLLKKLKGE